MKKIFKPKGRGSLPLELLQFGRHLVYAEGTKTEPYYIESIKKEIALKYKCKQNQIEIITAGDGTSYNTISLVKFAKKDVKSRIKKGELINHVWIFFDQDDFPRDHFINAHKMIINMNNSTNLNIDGFKFDKETEISWHSCFSNECFELWYCLYFEFYDGAHTRIDYKKFLNSKLKKGGSYSKTKEDMHQHLVMNGGNVDSAIKFSKKLSGINDLCNPSTGVYEFAEYFKPYMK